MSCDSQARSMVRNVLSINQTINLLKKPNGTKDFPAPSCCKLKDNYPGIKSGMLMHA